MTTPDTLREEEALFTKNLDEWREAHLGEFVLIKGGSVVGFFGSLVRAFEEGNRRFGLADFLVRQILPKDVVNVSPLGRCLIPS